MIHNQVQQVQQKINEVQQVVAQIRQSEQNVYQNLQRLAQSEANTMQQLQRAQQICQESMSYLQNITSGLAQPSFTAGMTQVPFQAGLPSQGTSTYTPSPVNQGPMMTSSLFDPTTLGPESYQNVMQYASQTHTPVATQAGIRQPGTQYTSPSAGIGLSSSMATSSPLSNISTMNPDVYLSSREQLGASTPNLSQIGQHAGISSTSSNTSQPGQQPGMPGGSLR